MIEPDDLLHGLKVLEEYAAEQNQRAIKDICCRLLESLKSEPLGTQADDVIRILSRCRMFPNLASMLWSDMFSQITAITFYG